MTSLGLSSETAPTAARAEEQNPAVVEMLSSLHRLLKVARMYDKNNQALAGSASAVITATVEYCASQGCAFADLMFANDTVFVNGRMLQMTREVYGRVMELGAMLDRCEISNVNVSRDTTVADLVGFVHMLGTALRDPTIKGELVKPNFGGIHARRIKWRAALEGDRTQSFVSRTVRTYSAAIVLLRRFHAAANEGQRTLPLAMRRVAQRIVTHAEEEGPLLVALAAARTRGTDEAAVSVSAALVAVLMARHVTTDRAVLTDLVLAALLHDVARHRLVSLRGADAIRSPDGPLGEDEQDRLPASGTVGLIAFSGVGDLAAPGAVISFEARWCDRAARLGAVYGGKRPPIVLARILSLARAFSELMVPSSYGADMRPDDAIEFLSSRATDDTQRIYVRLLTAGLGIFQPGTSVELNTGEIGVVVQVPDHAVDFARPPIRVMYDAAGNVLADPLDVDLAAQSLRAGETARFIRAALDTDAQQAQAMRAFVLSITRGKPKRQAAAVEPAPPARASLEEATQSRRHEAIVTAARPRTNPEPTLPRTELAPPRTNPEPTRPRTDPGATAAGSMPRPFGRPRSNPGPLPRDDGEISYPRIEQTGVPMAPSRPRTDPGAASAEDVARPFGRPRSNPGPLPRDDGEISYPRIEQTGVPMAPSRPRTDPGASAPSTTSGDAPRPFGRPRSNPGPLPRNDDADATSGAPPRSVTDGETTGRFGRPRTTPNPLDSSPSRITRPEASPQAFRPVDIVETPPATRPRTNPGPVDRTAAAGDVPKPFGRPRSNPGRVHEEYNPNADRRSEPNPTAPTQARTVAATEAPSHSARTVARNWLEVPREAERAASRPTREVPQQKPPDEPPAQSPVKPATVTRGAAINNAPTVARSWADFEDGLPPVTVPAPKPPVAAAQRPTRPEIVNPVSTAATVARSWGDFEAEGEPDGEDDPPGANATRKADWGGYGKLVTGSAPADAHAPKPTIKLPRPETPDPKKSR